MNVILLINFVSQHISLTIYEEGLRLRPVVFKLGSFSSSEAALIEGRTLGSKDVDLSTLTAGLSSPKPCQNNNYSAPAYSRLNVIGYTHQNWRRIEFIVCHHVIVFFLCKSSLCGFDYLVIYFCYSKTIYDLPCFVQLT